MVVVALLVLVPILELAVFVQVAQWIGVLEAALLLATLSLLGCWLVKSQGTAVWREGRATVAAGRIPGRAVVDALLVTAAGVLVLVPGFVTALCGLALLVPAGRDLVRTLLLRRWTATARSRPAGAGALPVTSRERSQSLQLGGGGAVEPPGEPLG
ncbi:MAG: FxsA family protein [Actinomycetota bacterium]